MSFLSSFMILLLRVLVAFTCGSLALAFETTTNLSSVQNFRSVLPNDPNCRWFRAAALDQLTPEDAKSIISNLGPDLTVIDLRNRDEIDKQTRSDGSTFFYNELVAGHSHHVPILNNVNAFWDEAIDRMDPKTKVLATLQTITQAGALDRAAARLLEDQGLSMLYTVMLATATGPLQQTMQICAHAPGSVVFHCQKGKDRTGIVAMMLQSCVNVEHTEIVSEYSLSGELLGEHPGSGKARDEERSGILDWSKFRGSPASAMVDTLAWIQQRHGSVEGYLVNALSLDPLTLQKLKQPTTSAMR